ncbi:MAG: hypothetical protein BJ554DRAFT_651, partial [Olpidium bornovanus]
ETVPAAVDAGDSCKGEGGESRFGAGEDWDLGAHGASGQHGGFPENTSVKRAGRRNSSRSSAGSLSTSVGRSRTGLKPPALPLNRSSSAPADLSRPTLLPEACHTTRITNSAPLSVPPCASLPLTATLSRTLPSQLYDALRAFDDLVTSAPAQAGTTEEAWKNLGTMRKGVAVFQKPVPGHPVGLLKGVGVFKDVGLWDLLAVVECGGARRICTLHHPIGTVVWLPVAATPLTRKSLGRGLCVRRFGHPRRPWAKLHFGLRKTEANMAGEVNYLHRARDAAVMKATVCTDPSTVRVVGVSAPGDYHGVPPEQPQHVRANIELSGWHISQSVKRQPKSVQQAVNGNPKKNGEVLSVTTRTTFIVKSNPHGRIPASILSAASKDVPLCVANASDYYDRFGAPPYLAFCRHGRIYDM